MPEILTSFHTSPVTFLLIIIITITSLLSIFVKNVFAQLFLHPYSVIKKKEYYRIITADFVHNDLVHLGLNMVSLYVFGSDLEETLLKKTPEGSWWFLIIFMSSLLTGNIFVSLINQNDFDYSSAGCSGSIIGCLFGFMVMNPYGKALDLAFIGGINNMVIAILFILAMIGFSLRQKKASVNHDIHFYGAIGGIAATLLLGHKFLF